MKYSEKDHTFAICAYKESSYLEKCIKSLLRQDKKSHIIMATSTPNDYIKNMSEKYNIELFVNDAKPHIASDWNFAYEKAKTKLVTIAHQDDVYDKDYLDLVIKAFNSSKNPIIAHTAYYEIRDNKKVFSNRLVHPSV